MTDTMLIRDALYIDGAWVPAQGSGTVDVINATTEEVMGRVPQGNAADVDRAVRAARAAFLMWSETPAKERARYLARIAEELQARSEAIATVIAQELGMPIRLAQIIQVGQPTRTFAAMPQILEEFAFEERIGNSRRFDLRKVPT